VRHSVYRGRTRRSTILGARTGAPLWHATTGGQISSAAVTYMVDGKQYVAISANYAVFAVGLR
jgi:hypothetical protein